LSYRAKEPHETRSLKWAGKPHGAEFSSNFRRGVDKHPGSSDPITVCGARSIRRRDGFRRARRWARLRASGSRRTPAMSYVYVVQMDIPAQHEADFNRIYDTEHVPMLSKVPGVINVTRYRLEKSNDSRMQKYLAIYEIEAPDVVDSKEWEVAGAWGDWATKIRPHTTSRHHSFFEKL
jgi:hypothetical protein